MFLGLLGDDDAIEAAADDEEVIRFHDRGGKKTNEWQFLVASMNDANLYISEYIQKCKPSCHQQRN